MTTPAQIQAVREAFEKVFQRSFISDDVLVDMAEAYERAAWIDIASAPKDGTPICIWVEGEVVSVSWKYKQPYHWGDRDREEGFGWYSSEFILYDPTLFRYITPPQEASNA